jgi:hypothetical protein
MSACQQPLFRYGVQQSASQAALMCLATKEELLLGLEHLSSR